MTESVISMIEAVNIIAPATARWLEIMSNVRLSSTCLIGRTKRETVDNIKLANFGTYLENYRYDRAISISKCRQSNTLTVP